MLNQTSKDGKLSKIDQTTFTQLNKSCQLNMRNFFTPTAKKTCGATPSVEVEVEFEVEASTTKTCGIRSWASKMAPVSCQGIMRTIKILLHNHKIFKCTVVIVPLMINQNIALSLLVISHSYSASFVLTGWVVFVKVIIVLMYIRVIIALN